MSKSHSTTLGKSLPVDIFVAIIRGFGLICESSGLISVLNTALKACG